MLAPGGKVCRGLAGGGPSPPREDAPPCTLRFSKCLSLCHRLGPYVEGKGSKKEQVWVPSFGDFLGTWGLDK